MHESADGLLKVIVHWRRGQKTPDEPHFHAGTQLGAVRDESDRSQIASWGVRDWSSVP